MRSQNVQFFLKVLDIYKNETSLWKVKSKDYRNRIKKKQHIVSYKEAAYY